MAITAAERRGLGRRRDCALVAVFIFLFSGCGTALDSSHFYNVYNLYTFTFYLGGSRKIGGFYLILVYYLFFIMEVARNGEEK